LSGCSGWLAAWRQDGGGLIGFDADLIAVDDAVPVMRHGPRVGRLVTGRPGENAGMAYQLQILGVIADAAPASLMPEVGTAITADGFWERFAEVRMGAGPRVCITADGHDGYQVLVSWGSQNGNLKAGTLRSAIECADRLAYAFYQMRAAGMVQD
jgi:hypothetical protein